MVILETHFFTYKILQNIDMQYNVDESVYYIVLIGKTVKIFMRSVSSYKQALQTCTIQMETFN